MRRTTYTSRAVSLRQYAGITQNGIVWTHLARDNEADGFNRRAVCFESAANLVAVDVASARRQEAHTSLRLVTRVLREVVQIIVLVLVVSDVAVTAKIEDVLATVFRVEGLNTPHTLCRRGKGRCRGAKGDQSTFASLARGASLTCCRHSRTASAFQSSDRCPWS